MFLSGQRNKNRKFLCFKDAAYFCHLSGLKCVCVVCIWITGYKLCSVSKRICRRLQAEFSGCSLWYALLAVSSGGPALWHICHMSCHAVIFPSDCHCDLPPFFMNRVACIIKNVIILICVLDGKNRAVVGTWLQSVCRSRHIWDHKKTCTVNHH